MQLSQILTAKQSIESLVRERFPGEAKYFEPIWAAFCSWLRSTGGEVPARAGRRARGSLAFTEGFGQVAQRSVEVIDAFIDTVRAAGDTLQVTEDAVKRHIFGRAKVFQADRELLAALTRVVLLAVGPIHNAPKPIRIDFTPGHVRISGPGKINTSQERLTGPWRLLEYLLWHAEEDVHWACGFAIFPEWRASENEQLLQSFMGHRSRLKRILTDLSPDGMPVANLVHGTGAFTRLEGCSFESNVLEAKTVYREATSLLASKNYTAGAVKAQDTLKVYEGCEDAFSLLLACYMATDFQGAERSEVKQLLQHVHVRFEALSAALQRMNRLASDVLMETQGLHKQWKGDIERLMEACARLEALLGHETTVSADYFACQALLGRLEQFQRTESQETRQRLWEEIQRDSIFMAGKAKAVARLEQTRKSFDPHDLDTVFFEHVGRLTRLEVFSQAALEGYIARVLFYRMVEHEESDRLGVSASELRQLRKLGEERDRLVKKLRRQPSNDQLCDALQCDEARLCGLLDLERWTKSVSYGENPFDSDAA